MLEYSNPNPNKFQIQKSYPNSIQWIGGDLQIRSDYE